MRVRRKGERMALAAAIVVIAQALAGVSSIVAVTPSEAFDAVWRTTDAAVANGTAGYSWFWGPEPRGQRYEDYLDSPGGQREVRYYDKSRMEITHPDGDPASIWYVTNGLLTVELVTGRRQTGDSAYEVFPPSQVLVAGDQQNNPGTPSYAEFAPFVTVDGQTNRASDRSGQAVSDFLTGDGTLGSTDSRGVTYASYQEPTGHNIANVFWEWAHDPNSGLRPDVGVDWLYVLGYPISEPYWIEATVANTPRPVLVQLFQRRVLTYDPLNPPAFRVEFGNIGLHYLSWLDDATMPLPGGELYGWSLADWPDVVLETGRAFVQGGAYHHVVYAPLDPDQPPIVFSYLSGFDREAVIASARLRVVSAEARMSEGCLVVRATADLLRNYALCLNAEGATVALYEEADEEEYDVTIFFDYDVRPGTNSPTQWNELTIAAVDDHLWFAINGVMIGDVRHASGLAGGTVGFYTINFDTDPVEFAWDALAVHAPQ